MGAVRRSRAAIARSLFHHHTIHLPILQRVAEALRVGGAKGLGEIDAGPAVGAHLMGEAKAIAPTRDATVEIALEGLHATGIAQGGEAQAGGAGVSRFGCGEFRRRRLG